ncbi:AAEL004637-PA [Aedes aegypti]|uniref:AAEL004637-PA n=1 Tax=Aedes aegypti TaxID=7159 RepID=Q17CC3_AEDAE|nr:AAEL004637-PA [Aedes aegypti]
MRTTAAVAPEAIPLTVPLYSGSSVYISLKDLIRIYSPKPALYTARLLDTVFGREVLISVDDAELLDPPKLQSVIGGSKLRAAKFGYTQKGKAMLLYNGYAYIKDRQAMKSCNWKCSLFGKLKCRARAVTKTVNDRQMMKITKPLHNHTRSAYSFEKKNEKKNAEEKKRNLRENETWHQASVSRWEYIHSERAFLPRAAFPDVEVLVVLPAEVSRPHRYQ